MTELGKNIAISDQCFPVRSLTRNNAKDGGAWLIAYKAEQRRRFKAVLCREPDVTLSGKPSESKQSSKSRKSVGSVARRKLDGIYLMNSCSINDPLDLYSISISGKGLTLANEDDFTMFKNVIHIDAGDNNLDLVNFRQFPSLKTLELPLNNICGTVVLEDKDFVWLETLDLSCNHLTPDDVLALGILPVLKILHLTGNQLNELPQEMCRTFSLKKGRKQSRFASLEKLWLDQNNLTDVNTFTCLAGLRRLKYLNLEHNNITSVPHLRIFEPKTKLLVNNDHRTSHSAETLTPNLSNVIDEEIEDVNTKISILEEILYNGTTDVSGDRSDVIDTESGAFSRNHLQDGHTLPFPSLRHLNLANNEIKTEEGLLKLSTWPRLEEVVIWGNPVATCGKRGPPVVTFQLGLVAGIEITRYKPSDKKPKDTSSLALVAPRKVPDVSTISQTRRLLMLEAPKQLGYHIKPLPPIPSTADCDNERRKRVSSAPAKTHDIQDEFSNDREKLHSFNVHRPTRTEQNSSFMDDSSFFTPRQNVVSPEERVFLTQAEDAEYGDNEEVMFFNNTNEAKSNVKEKDTESTVPVKSKPVIAKKYKGYEDLLNIDEQYPEDIKLPKSVHGNVRALQYALHHPLIYTERSARYRNERSTKPNQRTDLSSYKNNRPTTVDELGSILDKMRTHTKTVESNLGYVLGHKHPRNKKEFKEAKKLLNEVQTKYDEVRCESLRSTNIAAEWADILRQKPGVFTPTTIHPPTKPVSRQATTRDVPSSRGRSREINGMITENGATKM